MKEILIVIPIVLAISGCVTTQPITLNNDFSEKEAAIINKTGNNTIKGNAFLRQNGGGVVTCAGSDVVLLPATQYAKERIKNIYGNIDGGVRLVGQGPVEFSNNSQDYMKMSKSTKCDSDGNFEFNNIANGEYYVTTRVIWQSGYAHQGGVLAKLTSVKNGKTEKLIITQ